MKFNIIRAGVLKEAEKADFRRSGLLDEGSGREMSWPFPDIQGAADMLQRQAN